MYGIGGRCSSTMKTSQEARTRWAPGGTFPFRISLYVLYCTAGQGSGRKRPSPARRIPKAGRHSASERCWDLCATARIMWISAVQFVPAPITCRLRIARASPESARGHSKARGRSACLICGLIGSGADTMQIPYYGARGILSVLATPHRDNPGEIFRLGPSRLATADGITRRHIIEGSDNRVS